jgi:hypothetical protein
MSYTSPRREGAIARLYVDTAYDPDPATNHDRTTAPERAYDVLARVLANECAEWSAHETLERAQHKRTTLPISRTSTRRSPAWLNSNIRRAPRPAPMDKCTIGPKRSTRLEATSRRQPHRRTTSSSGGAADPCMVRALGDRDKVKQRQAGELAERAIARDDWVRGLACPPADPAARELWMAAVSTVAAYRDRRTIGPLSPLGDNAGKSIEALAERRRLQVALNGALRLVAMPKTAQLTLSAETSCSDGICGEVDRVIIDPDTKAVTHIVVEAKLGVLPAGSFR